MELMDDQEYQVMAYRYNHIVAMVNVLLIPLGQTKVSYVYVISDVTAFIHQAT